MNIDFFATNQDISLGSYRIWVHDLSTTLRALGCSVRVVNNFEKLQKNSVVILSKADYHLSTHPVLENRCVGAINVARDHNNLPLDFIIVGSPEEKISLMTAYKNVSVVNLYEKMYENEKVKNHTKKSNICIGYHGSYIHLIKLSQGFIAAFSDLSNFYDLHFLNVTNRPDIARNILLDNGLREDQFSCRKWSFDNVVRDIHEMDIGIVPNLIDQFLINPEISKQISVQNGINSTDYVFRFKNKSNPGRAFVFYQLGIPVIADLTPSNMPMLYDEKCGFIANCSRSWYYQIEKLLDHDLRNSVSSSAKLRFEKKYNPVEDAKRLLKNIMEIKDE